VLPFLATGTIKKFGANLDAFIVYQGTRCKAFARLRNIHVLRRTAG